MHNRQTFDIIPDPIFDSGKETENSMQRVHEENGYQTPERRTLRHTRPPHGSYEKNVATVE
jgi:hypothetical protein